jgi:MerR family transcriptional regulator, light-induced transcriptional regulator
MAAEAASNDPAVRRVVRDVLRAVGRGDAVAVHAIVQRLLDEGWSPGAVVTSCLAGVEREIGRRWQERRWTVAQEHAATAIVDDELARLAAALPPPSLDIAVMVVCAESEWHVTPARMAALLLRERGFRVQFVGGSVPADELDRTLAESPPDYLAVSCTYGLALAGAAGIAAVARQRGIPTLAGGAGFGASPHRALRLGMTGWAGSVRDGAERLLQWHDGSPPVVDTAGPAVDLDALDDRWREMADEVLDRLRATDAVHPSPDQPVAPLRQDITELLQAAHLTVLCDDPTLFTDHIDQLGSAPWHRGLPRDAIPATIEILRQLVGVYEPMDVESHARLNEAIRHHAPSIADAAPMLGGSAAIARTLIEVEDPDLLRQRLLALANDMVDGCDHAGLVMLDHGEYETPVSSSQLADELEELEREVGEGPWLEAVRRREMVESAELATEDRWPDYGRAAVERTATHSVLAIPLIVRRQLFAVLEFFAEEPDAFDDQDRSAAVSLATHAAIALHVAIQQRTLTEAIGTRDIIGQAKGILMEREGIDDARAFELLRTVSNQTNAKLRDVAGIIVRHTRAD